MTDASAAELDARIARLADRAALGDLAERYLASLDEGTFDDAWARSFFTEDVELTFPVGSHRGRAGVAAFTREIMERWDGTHHHGSPPLVELDGDRATVAWSLIASHLHFDSPRPPAASRYFQLGGRFDTSVRRTPAGWRFARMRLRITWSTGPASAAVTSVDEGTLGTGALLDGRGAGDSGSYTDTHLEGSTA
ncbi:nuclear transport factor 2 family protein [Streptomyces sp. NPDC126497]|uniref:nuclear transport factor 2 family protein n=1 Tax=Streptomyces sp. NPDC126497 TaxID=3155313 RepID=UPI0033227CD5